MELQSPQKGDTLTESGEGQKGLDNMQKIRESEKNNFEDPVQPPNFTAEKTHSESLTDLLTLQVSYRIK